MTQPPSCSSCPLAGKAKGFCLGSGDPATARMAIVLETPAVDEIGYFLDEMTPRDVVPNVQEEIARRAVAYPDIPRSYLSRGVPVVGRTGAVLNYKLLPAAGIRRRDVFVDNALRCYSPKGKNGQHYPTDVIKDKAQAECRKYDRLREFAPDVIVETLHPSALFKEVTPEPLLIEDLRKSQQFVAQGKKVLVLMGGHAAEVFLGFGTNVSRWRGHYEVMERWGGSSTWYERRVEELKTKAEKAGRKKVQVCECGHEKEKHADVVCTGQACFCLKYKRKAAPRKKTKAEVLMADPLAPSKPCKKRAKKVAVEQGPAIA